MFEDGCLAHCVKCTGRGNEDWMFAGADRQNAAEDKIDGILYQSKGSPGTSYCLLLVLQEELQRHPGCSAVVGGAAGGTLTA